MESWAVDLASVGAVYPWQGKEVVMTVAAVVAWIVWHIRQLNYEAAEFREDVGKYNTPEKIKKAAKAHED